MFSNKSSSNLNSVISAFDNLKETIKKYSESQSKAFLNLQDWSSDGNNIAIQDVSSKLMNLFVKLNNDLNPERIYALKEIIDLFKKFKESDSKLEKLHQEMLNAEKLEKKRHDELAKCSLSKNIRDYEVRLYKSKLDKEKLQLKYYDLCKETEASKAILFKTNFLRLNNSLLKQNKAEQILLNAMTELLNQVPDMCDNDMKDMSYESLNETNNICHKATINMNNLIQSSSSSLNPSTSSKMNRKHCSFLKQKKIKSRISCPPNIFPRLDDLITPPTYSDSERNQRMHTLTPSAPPRPDSESSFIQQHSVMPQISFYVNSPITPPTNGEKSKQ